MKRILSSSEPVEKVIATFPPRKKARYTQLVAKLQQQVPTSFVTGRPQPDGLYPSFAWSAQEQWHQGDIIKTDQPSEIVGFLAGPPVRVRVRLLEQPQVTRLFNQGWVRTTCIRDYPINECERFLPGQIRLNPGWILKENLLIKTVDQPEDNLYCMVHQFLTTSRDKLLPHTLLLQQWSSSLRQRQLLVQVLQQRKPQFEDEATIMEDFETPSSRGHKEETVCVYCQQTQLLIRDQFCQPCWARVQKFVACHGVLWAARAEIRRGKLDHPWLQTNIPLLILKKVSQSLNAQANLPSRYS